MSRKNPISIISIGFLVLAILFSFFPGGPVQAAGPSVFINEIHYDNASTDAGEAVEIAGPAGTDLTGWSLVFYTGSTGADYGTTALSGTIPDEENGYGTLSFPVTGIQNGDPDGLALVDASSAVVQFLSYEGFFTAVGGPADGLTSVDIGVSEPGDTPVGDSLQLTGSGTGYDDFSWAAAQPNTFGTKNTGQTFGGVIADSAPIVSSTSPEDGALDVALAANLEINFSEAVDAVDSWFEISCDSSGLHTAAVSVDPTTFILNPDTDFAYDEYCTVSLIADKVTDQDVDDPPNTMAADYVFGFTTEAEAVDLAPSVLSTVPADGGVDIALDANLEITFSEDVNLGTDWFGISCASSGLHTAAVNGGPTAFSLDPDDDFVNDELCTISIFAAQVTDQDVDDPPDAMTANFGYSFSTEAEVVADPPMIIITEIMYDPLSAEDNWEWIEIYNGGSSSVNLAGFVVDDYNSVAHPSANIAEGTLAAGQQAVLYNVDDVSAADFQAAWGTVNLIPVTHWSAMALNNSGDQIGIWSSFTSYTGDNVAHANAIESVNYVDFVDPAGKSIYLTDLAADNTLPANWDASSDGGATPLYTGYSSLEAAGNVGGELGSPGEPPAVVVEVVINEFSASTTGTDVEYLEIYGTPSVDFSDYVILEIEGDFDKGTGVVDEVVSLGTTDADGFYLANLSAGKLENGTISLLLVQNFSGVFGDDLDADDDGVLDNMPWDALVDAVSVNDGGTGDLTYGIPVLGKNYDGVSAYAPGGASRIPDGIDTDAPADWVRNDYDLAGIPGFTGTLAPGEALNTPGTFNEVYVAPPEVCGDPFTPIYDIQGSGLASSLDGIEVSTEGIVVGDFQSGKSGYFIQDAAGDGDLSTSDGIFVYGETPDVSVGDHVRVHGFVDEYYDLTEVTGVSLVLDCGIGTVAPSPLTLPLVTDIDLEPYEGMLVTFAQPLFITEYYNFARYGEIVLANERQFQPTASYEPGSPEAAQALLDNELARIKLDDGRSSQNPDPALHPNGSIFDMGNLFRGGDILNNLTGVVDFSYGEYVIQPTLGADYVSANPRTAQPDYVGAGLKVASFNVLNYFTTLDDGTNDICGPTQDMECRGADTIEEFNRQRAKIIAALAAIDADVVGLIEIENNEFEAVADLVDGLNAVVAGTYAYVDTGYIGSDAIKVAFIYKTGTVSLVGDYAVLDESVDSRFIDSKNRPSLAQTFQDNITEGVFTVVVNHLKSKGSSCDDIGDPDLDDGAGNCNLTRTAAAEALVDWLATDPTGSGDADFMIIGDLNSYDKEDPIDAIVAGGYSDMVYQFIGEDAYSYVYDGQLGYLDHALAMTNGAMSGEVSGATVWHINADEPNLIDYDMSYKKDAQDALYAPDPYRSSDHDPVIIGLDVCEEIAPTLSIELSVDTLWPANHKMVEVTAVVTANDNFDTDPVVTLVSIISSEEDEAIGDGNTSDDIVIEDDFTFLLRAERSGKNKDGRIYLITYQVEDACGNTTLGFATVTVPFSQNKK